MDVFHERQEERLKRIFPNDLVELDGAHEVYGIPGVEAFGKKIHLID